MGAKISVDEEARKTIVAVGVTGAGKSSTCNLLTGSRVFDEHQGLCSSTDMAYFVDSQFQGNHVRVIDTMGFLHNQEFAEHQSSFAQFSDLASFGVDVFLLTERFGRFTEAEVRHFNFFKELAGPEALRHTLLLFTHVTNKQLHDCLEEGSLPDCLRLVIEQVGGVVGVESKTHHRAAAADLQRAIEELLIGNDGKRYSNQAILGAKERREALQGRIDALSDPLRRQPLGEKRVELSQGLRTYEEIRSAVEEAEAAERDGRKAARVERRRQGCLVGCTSGICK